VRLVPNLNAQVRKVRLQQATGELFLGGSVRNEDLDRRLHALNQLHV
jgi:hypothetical protein